MPRENRILMQVRATLFLCAIAGLAIGWTSPRTALAAGFGRVSAQTALRNEAIRRIPFDRMDADAKAKAMAVIKNTSVFRRLPVQSIDCDPNFYLFLVRHPEVVVQIWRLMGVTDLSLERTGPESFVTTDGASTSGKVEFLYGDHKRHVIYTEGSYSGPLSVRPIRGRCLLVLSSDIEKQSDGRYKITNRMDAFIEVRNVAVELIAKTFQNMFGKTTDYNFIETSRFVEKLAQTAVRNTAGMYRMAARLRKLDPQVRGQFVEQITLASKRAAQRGREGRGQEVRSQVMRGQSPPRR